VYYSGVGGFEGSGWGSWSGVWRTEVGKGAEPRWGFGDEPPGADDKQTVERQLQCQILTMWWGLGAKAPEDDDKTKNANYN